MRVRHWLIGCAICFAGIGGAAATSTDSRELDGSMHGNADSGSLRDLSSSEPGTANDPVLSRDNAQHGAGDPHKSASGSGTTDHASMDAVPPAHVQQTHLGWQSLLPGSIQ